MLQNNLHANIYKLTFGHANFRMLSPSVCRLTLPLPVLCRGTSSLVFPCTSLEIGRRSAASAERSSASPSSLFEALMLENGQSPESFSSFSLAQNILGAVKDFPSCLCLLLLLPSLSLLYYLISERDRCGGAAADPSISWSHPGDAFALSASRRAGSNGPSRQSQRDLSQCAVKAAWTTDGWEPSLAENQWSAGEKKNEQKANPCAIGAGVGFLEDLSAKRNHFQATARMQDFFPPVWAWKSSYYPSKVYKPAELVSAWLCWHVLLELLILFCITRLVRVSIKERHGKQSQSSTMSKYWSKNIG